MGKADRIAPQTGVEVEDRNGVSILKLITPASGALTASLRKSIVEALYAIEANGTAKAVVLIGGRGVFSIGTSLETEPEAGAPLLVDVCDRVEAMPIPVVAALNGAALGNGFELAIAAHYRLVSPSSRLGAPEITIGLVPSGGATQRLPKLVGGVAALKLLLSGRSVNGPFAVKLGLADKLIEGDLREGAIAFAEQVAASTEPLPRNSQRRDRLGKGGAFLEAVAQHKAAAERTALQAPKRLIECIEAALLLPYDIGRGLEAAAFDDLVQSEEARALRYVVSTERRLQASTAEVGRVPSRQLKSVGILAARGLGNEVAVAAMDAGFSVTVAERTDEALEAGVTRIIEHYDARVASSKMSEDAVEATLDRMHAVCGYRTLDNVDIVIDPGPSIARARVGEIDAVLKAGAIFATGSEHVELSRVAASTGRPADVVGLKLYPGMLKNRIVELSVLDQTSPRATETARAFARKLGRMVVRVGPSKLGVGSKLTEALHAAADAAVIEGASISQVDAALREWGIPLGSFAWRDALGLERALRDRHAGNVDARLAATGRTGRAAGRGFYAYARRGQPGTEDPAVSSIIDEMRAERGVVARQVGHVEIQRAAVAAMAGAGADMLAEGMVQQPSDIDMVSIHGLGFARRTGGVMFAADQIGLAKIKTLLARLSTRDPRIAPPSPIFDDLIRANRTFAALDP